MAGLFALIASTLLVCFVWTPLGFFVWLGIPDGVILFKSGYRILAGVLVVLFYFINGALLYRCVQTSRRWPYVVSIVLMWGLGFAGFMHKVFHVSNQFQ